MTFEELNGDYSQERSEGFICCSFVEFSLLMLRSFKIYSVQQHRMQGKRALISYAFKHCLHLCHNQEFICEIYAKSSLIC